ncbi:MAG: copper resistance protein CopD, partial [Bacillota bacterium]|nr:copper resistance protein CopD [Bacillota bacterium]
MIILSVLCEALLYVCFSILIGCFFLNLLPDSIKPEIAVPKWIVLATVSGVALFSFMPVLKIVLYLYQDLGLGLTLRSVLLNFEVGKAWITTGVLSIILLIFLSPIKLEQNRLFSVVGMILMLSLVGALGWS